VMERVRGGLLEKGVYANFRNDCSLEPGGPACPWKVQNEMLGKRLT
jgi:hypothetical protein